MTQAGKNFGCEACKDEGWVCETHGTAPWETCPQCEVHEGVPCVKCNPCDEHNPPRMQPGFVSIFDEDGFHPHIVGGKDKK